MAVDALEGFKNSLARWTITQSDGLIYINADSRLSFQKGSAADSWTNFGAVFNHAFSAAAGDTYYIDYINPAITGQWMAYFRRNTAAFAYNTTTVGIWKEANDKVKAMRNGAAVGAGTEFPAASGMGVDSTNRFRFKIEDNGGALNITPSIEGDNSAGEEDMLQNTTDDLTGDTLYFQIAQYDGGSLDFLWFNFNTETTSPTPLPNRVADENKLYNANTQDTGWTVVNSSGNLAPDHAGGLGTDRGLHFENDVAETKTTYGVRRVRLSSHYHVIPNLIFEGKFVIGEWGTLTEGMYFHMDTDTILDPAGTKDFGVVTRKPGAGSSTDPGTIECYENDSAVTDNDPQVVTPGDTIVVRLRSQTDGTIKAYLVNVDTGVETLIGTSDENYLRVAPEVKINCVAQHGDGLYVQEFKVYLEETGTFPAVESSYDFSGVVTDDWEVFNSVVVGTIAYVSNVLTFTMTSGFPATNTFGVRLLETFAAQDGMMWEYQWTHTTGGIPRSNRYLSKTSNFDLTETSGSERQNYGQLQSHSTGRVHQISSGNGSGGYRYSYIQGIPTANDQHISRLYLYTESDGVINTLPTIRGIDSGRADVRDMEFMHLAHNSTNPQFDPDFDGVSAVNFMINIERGNSNVLEVSNMKIYKPASAGGGLGGNNSTLNIRRRRSRWPKKK